MTEESEYQNNTNQLTNKHPRYFFFDNIRVLLTFGVIIGHAAITYGAAGSWFYQEPADLPTVIIFTLLASIGQSFAMGLFFFMAGFFEPQSLERKGMKFFIKDRIFRLGLSFCLFTFFLYFLIIWMTDRVVLGLEIGFIEDYLFNIRSGNIDSGPLWFVFYLLILSLSYAVLYRFFTIPKETLSHIKINNKSISIFILILGLVTFFIRIWYPQTTGIESIEWIHLQIGTSPQYISFFILGILCYRYNWLHQFTPQMGRYWLKIAIFCALFIPILTILSGAIDKGATILLGGVAWPAFLYAMNEMCLGTAISIVILSRSQLKWNHHGNLARFLSQNAFTVYIFHAIFVVGFALLFREINWYPMLKWLLLCVAAVVSSYLFAWLFRKIPGISKIL